MNWLTDYVKPKLSSLIAKKDTPSDLWTNCSKCNLMLYKSELKENLFVCSNCDDHMHINIKSRLENIFDNKTTPNRILNTYNTLIISKINTIEWADMEA